MEQITKKLFIERLKNEKNILVGSITVNRIEKLEDVIKMLDEQKERLYSNINNDSVVWRTLKKAYTNHLCFSNNSNIYFDGTKKSFYSHEKFIICDDDYFRIIYLMN